MGETIQTKKDGGEFVADFSPVEPYDYQWEIYHRTINHIRTSPEPAFVYSSVSSGKTIMQAMIAKHAQDKAEFDSAPQLQILMLARTGELVDQNAEECWNLHAKNSIFSASLRIKSTTYPVIVGSERTVFLALDHKLAKFTPTILLIDECHQVDYTNPDCQYMKIINEMYRRNPNLRVIGYTGSPWRGVEPIKGQFWKHELYRIDMWELVKRGKVEPPIFGFGHDDVQYDLSGINPTGKDGTEDFGREELREMQKRILDSGSTTQKIMLEVMAAMESRNCALITCAGSKHIKECATVLPEGSYATITERTTYQERKKIKERANKGELKYILQIGCWTVGVNIPPIDTIVILRKIGSLTLLTQLIGRGIRKLKDEHKKLGMLKKDCLERGTKILTDKGEINIEDVTLDHKVWDGVNFVNHGGAVCKGLQRVISYDGLVATPDHEVMTEYGWESISEAKRNRRRIVRSGMGGEAIRVSDDSFNKNGRKVEPASRGGFLRKVWPSVHEQHEQHEEKAENKSLPQLQQEGAANCPEMALQEVPSAKGPVPEPEQQPLPLLRWARNKIQFQKPKRSSDMDSKKHRDKKQGSGAGQNRQRRALRARKYKVGPSGREYCERKKITWLQGAVYFFQKILPFGSLFRQNTIKVNVVDAGRGNSCKMDGGLLKKTEREVWDIHNAGPLQRFTANGRLVHNCLVLDYAGTMESIGHLFNDPILESAEFERAKRKNEIIDCPRCNQPNSKFARRCIGPDAAEKDGRCGFFWQSQRCPECNTENDIVARECRECGHQLQDPNAKLTGKHYTDADLKDVLKMDMTLTKNRQGVLIRYQLPNDEVATEVFYPNSDKAIAKKLWYMEFVNKHLHKSWHNRVRGKSAAAIVGMRAVFDVPTHLTHRINGKGKSVIHRKVFLSGRIESK